MVIQSTVSPQQLRVTWEPLPPDFVLPDDPGENWKFAMVYPTPQFGYGELNLGISNVLQRF